MGNWLARHDLSCWLGHKTSTQTKSYKKINRKVQGVPQSQTAANPTPRGREKWQKLTPTKQTNKCTRSTQTSSLFPKWGDHDAKKMMKRGQRARENVKRNIKKGVVINGIRIPVNTWPSTRYNGIKSKVSQIYAFKCLLLQSHKAHGSQRGRKGRFMSTIIHPVDQTLVTCTVNHFSACTNWMSNNLYFGFHPKILW